MWRIIIGKKCAKKCSFMTMRVDDEVYISRLGPPEKSTYYFSIFIILLWKILKICKYYKFIIQLYITTYLLTTHHVAIKVHKIMYLL